MFIFFFVQSHRCFYKHQMRVEDGKAGPLAVLSGLSSELNQI